MQQPTSNVDMNKIINQNVEKNKMILQKTFDLSAEFEPDDIEAESGANNVESVMFSNLDADQM